MMYYFILYYSNPGNLSRNQYTRKSCHY